MELIDKVIQFSGKSVPPKLAAEIMGKSYDFVRIGLTQGVLPFGVAIQLKGSNNTFYISPKLFYEYTGRIVTEEEIDKFNAEEKEKYR